MKKLKNFRKFNTKNTDRFFHVKYWFVGDKELAEQLKIDTSESAIGDIYLVRPASNFNLNKLNARIKDYDYSSQKLLTSDDIDKDPQGMKSYAKILEQAFNSPIIVRDYMQFAMLTQKFKTNVFVVYCDPEEDPLLYKRILKSLVRARKIMPINLTPNEEGDLQNQNRNSDVLFVLSSIKGLMPVLKLHENGPQGVFVKPDEQHVDLLNTTLASLERIEGLPREEFIAKAKNADEEFAVLPTDDDKE